MDNYAKGRTFEYARMKVWEEKGYQVIRSAGSHGPFDLVAFRANEVHFIQCKVVQTEATAQRMMGLWIANPPLDLCDNYEQHIEISIRQPPGRRAVVRVCSV